MPLSQTECLNGCQADAGGFLQAVLTGRMVMVPSLSSCCSLLLCRANSQGIMRTQSLRLMASIASLGDLAPINALLKALSHMI